MSRRYAATTAPSGRGHGFRRRWKNVRLARVDDFVQRIARLPRPSRSTLLLPAIVAALLLGAAAPAGATSEIEGVWSFNGGQVAIQSAPGGTFLGTVVTTTRFAQCPHQAGEQMWTQMRPQPDGSYWGLHQWLFEGTCEPNPLLGPTAWRVLQAAGGVKTLQVCFSEPGKTQPTIAPDGAVANATYGCSESAPTAPLPVVANSGSGTSGAEQISFPKTVVLPKATLCVRRRSLKIQLRDPKYDPLKEVVVQIGHRRIADVRGVARLRRGIVLKGLPTGSYTVRVLAITVLDQRLSGRRVYRSCEKRSSGNVPLRHPRSRRRR